MAGERAYAHRAPSHLVDAQPAGPVDPGLCLAFLLMLAAGGVAYIVTNTAFTSTPLISVHGVAVFPLDVVIAAALALLLLALHAGPLPLTRGLPRLMIAMIAVYLIYQIVIVLPVAVGVYSLEPFTVIRAQAPRYALIFIPSLYLVALRGVSLKRAIAVWTVAAVVVASYAVIAYLTKGAVGGVTGGTYRLRETSGGASLLEGWLILLGLLYWKPSRGVYALAALGFVGLALTNHRSAFVALVVACLFHLVFNRAFASRTLAVVAVVLVLLVTISVVSPVVWTSTRYSLVTMFDPNADANAQDRVQKSSRAWGEFLEHPYGDSIWRNTVYEYGDWEVHNFVMQFLSQEGLVATVFLLFLIGATFRIGWRNKRRDRLTATLLTYLVFFLVFCLFNTNLRAVQDIALLAFVVAAVLRMDDLLRLDLLKSERLAPRTLAESQL